MSETIRAKLGILRHASGTIICIDEIAEGARRWMKWYASCEDASWDMEYLGLLPAVLAKVLRVQQPGPGMVTLATRVRDPKVTLRSFGLYPVTPSH